ncbi:MAG: hypothetical protein RIR51_1793 [Bacteroidota bacterium]|jgi:glycosyltransferase involved in cell wall biosynthesis
MDKQNPFLSLIIPVYNRPKDVFEVLESLSKQTETNFEVLVIEDGSTEKADEEVKKFTNKLTIKYFWKENSGPSDTRNFGLNKAEGDFLIILDSDLIIPEKYIAIINNSLKNEKFDCFGGPDGGFEKFTEKQLAINFAMTSFLTTGGIRGSKLNKKFYPRSFNMGFTREVLNKTEGFNKNLLIGEDIDLSIRIYQLGFKVIYIDEAIVFHKRRGDFEKFFKQVSIFGKARFELSKIHPGSLKVIHLLPLVYLFSCIGLLILGIFISQKAFLPILFINFLFGIEASKKVGFKSVHLAIFAANIQLIGYALGFISGIKKHKN